MRAALRLARIGLGRIAILRMASLAAACSLAACAAPAPPPAAPPRPAASAPTPSVAPWQIYTDPVAGISVALPGEPRAVSDRHPEMGVARGLELSSESGGFDYSVMRLIPPPGKMIAGERFVNALAESWKRAGKPEKKTRGGLTSFEVDGVSPQGPTRIGVINVGAWAYIITAYSKQKLDPDAVERVFDSVRIEPPWRIEAFPEGLLTAALPATAAVMPSPKNAPPGMSMHVYSIGSGPQRTFVVSWFPIPDSRRQNVTVDDLLNASVKAIAMSGGNKVEKVESVDLRGVAGREVSFTTPDGSAGRARVLLVGQTGYYIAVTGANAAELEDDTANRFFESIRLGVTP